MKDLTALLHSTNVTSEWRKDVKGRDYLFIRNKETPSRVKWLFNDKPSIGKNRKFTYGAIIYFYDKSVSMRTITITPYKALKGGNGKIKHQVSSERKEKLRKAPVKLRYHIESKLIINSTKKGNSKVLIRCDKRMRTNFVNITNKIKASKYQLKSKVGTFANTILSDEKFEVRKSYIDYLTYQIKQGAKNRNINLGV